MFETDKWQEIFGVIRKNKLRTILTAFSVAWGIFILIILLAAGQGLRNGARSQFGNDAANSIWIDGGVTSLPWEGYKPGREIQLKNADFSYVLENIPEVDHASAVYRGWESRILSYGKEHAAFTVRSCAPDHNLLERAEVVSGRFINELDFRERRKVCVIGMPVKETLFRDEDAVNKMIDVDGIKYAVVGVFNDPGRGDNERIYIPLSTAQRVFNGKDHVNVIWATTGGATVERTEGMVSELRNYFATKYHFDPADKGAVNIYNNNVEYQRVMDLLDGIRLFIYVIGVLTLIAGIVGVSNIMMISVKERTREIGVRKALGASPGSIVSLIMQESLFITFIAGYVGMMSGIGLVELLKAAGLEGDFFRNPDVDIRVATSALMLIIVAGLLAGLFPALRAAKVEPITALREE